MLDSQPLPIKGESLVSPEKPKPLEFWALSRFSKALVPIDAIDATRNSLNSVVKEATCDPIITYDPQGNVSVHDVPNALSIHPYMEALDHHNIDTESYFLKPQVWAVSSDLIGLRQLDVLLGSRAGDLYVLAGLEAQLRAVYELCSYDDLDKSNLPLGIVRRISGDESLTTLINPQITRPSQIEALIHKHMGEILNTQEFLDIKAKLRDKLSPDEQMFPETLGLKSHALNLGNVPVQENSTPHVRLGEMDAHVIDIAEKPDLQLPVGTESNAFSQLLYRTYTSQPKPPPNLYEYLQAQDQELSDENLSNIFPPRFAGRIKEARQKDADKDKELVGWVLQQLSDRVYPIQEVMREDNPEFRMVYKAEVAPEVIPWWCAKHGIKEISVSFIGPAQLKPINIDHGHAAGDHVIRNSIEFAFEISDELIQQTATRNNLDILIFKSRGSTICITTPEHTIALQQALYEAQIEQGNKLTKLPPGVNQNNQPLLVMTGAVPETDGYTTLSTIQVDQDPIAFQAEYFQAVDEIRSQHYYNEKLWMMLFRPDVFLRSISARVKADAVSQIATIYDWIFNPDRTDKPLPFKPTVPWSSTLLKKLRIDDNSKSPQPQPEN